MSGSEVKTFGVGFIDWLGRVCSISPIAAKNEFWNASAHDRANNWATRADRSAHEVGEESRHPTCEERTNKM